VATVPFGKGTELVTIPVCVLCAVRCEKQALHVTRYGQYKLYLKSFWSSGC